LIYQNELDQILKAAEAFDEAVFGLADMINWHDDALDYFVEQEILKSTKPATEAECDGCILCSVICPAGIIEIVGKKQDMKAKITITVTIDDETTSLFEKKEKATYDDITNVLFDAYSRAEELIDRKRIDENLED